MCPTCRSDFVEQIQHEPVEEIDPSQMIFESILGRFLNMSQNTSSMGSMTINRYAYNDNIRAVRQPNPLNQTAIHRDNQVPPQLALLLQILTRGIPVETLPMHGQAGDYIISDRGLDTIISQCKFQSTKSNKLVMEQYASDNMPPPAPSDAVEILPRIKIRVEELDGNTGCPICQDDFKQDEEAIKLPCKHLFHPNCIIEWLKVNGEFNCL